MYPIGSKLGVNELFYKHVGAYCGEGMVFHNHWKNGAEIIPLQQFSNGKKVHMLDQGVQDIGEFWHRVRQLLAHRKSYNLVTNNCEHSASYVRDGVATSPQLIFFGAVSLIALGIGVSRYSR